MKKPTMQSAEAVLIAIYLDYLNNYLTAAYYAQCNGLTTEQGERLINLAREVARQEEE